MEFKRWMAAKVLQRLESKRRRDLRNALHKLKQWNEAIAAYRQAMARQSTRSRHCERSAAIQEVRGHGLPRRFAPCSDEKVAASQ